MPKHLPQQGQFVNTFTVTHHRITLPAHFNGTESYRIWDTETLLHPDDPWPTLATITHDVSCYVMPCCHRVGDVVERLAGPVLSLSAKRWHARNAKRETPLPLTVMKLFLVYLKYEAIVKPRFILSDGDAASSNDLLCSHVRE